MKTVSISIRPTWWERIKIMFGADICFGCSYEPGECWGVNPRIWVGSIHDK